MAGKTAQNDAQRKAITSGAFQSVIARDIADHARDLKSAAANPGRFPDTAAAQAAHRQV